MKIHAVDRHGKEYTLEGREGWSVMEILRDGGLDVAAECGGACACATCHVYVNEGWFEKLRFQYTTSSSNLQKKLGVS